MSRLSASLLSLMVWFLVGGVSLHAAAPRLAMDSLPSPFHKIRPLLKVPPPPPESREPLLTPRSSIGSHLLLQRSQPGPLGGMLRRDGIRMAPEQRRQAAHCTSALRLPTRLQSFFPRHYSPPSASDEPFPTYPSLYAPVYVGAPSPSTRSLNRAARPVSLLPVLDALSVENERDVSAEERNGIAMDTKKIPLATTPHEVSRDFSPQEEQKEESRKRILFQSLFWFLIPPVAGLLVRKWLLQL